MPKHITVHDLKTKLDNNTPLLLIDCREEDEYKFCHIEGALLLPISEFQQKATHTLNRDDPIHIICHKGHRSRLACDYLQAKGYKDVTNVEGGIEVWALQIDSKMPRY